MRNPLLPKGVYRTARPKMGDVHGKTWDVLKVILLDGTTIEGHLDTTWGHNFYFQLSPGGDHQWYYASVDQWVQDHDLVADFRKTPKEPIRPKKP